MRMPAEWAPHERTIVCWPARESMWQEAFADAKAEHAAVVNAIAAFEPVTLAVDPSQEAEARAAVRGDVDVVAIPLDDSWARDSGPIFVTGGGSGRASTSPSTPGARCSPPTTTTRSSPRACSSTWGRTASTRAT